MWLVTILFGWEEDGGKNMGCRLGQTIRLGGTPIGTTDQVEEIVFALATESGGLVPALGISNLSVKRKGRKQ